MNLVINMLNSGKGVNRPMRESSLNNLPHSQKTKDIRGGEKKVMKKSLSVILSTAMALSVFSSVAFADTAKKTSADFTDLKDLTADQKVKFDALISAGIFDGVSTNEFGIKQEMTRAQFAKVAALIFGLKVDTSLKTSSFSDVKSDDAANGFAVPYIEAVKAAGITDGYAPGQFNPSGQVTKEQLAVFLVRGLGKDAEGKATPGVTDKTVSDWAKGYVALAIQLKLLSNNADGSFGGTNAATRDLLVLGSYEAKQQYVPAGKLTVVGAKATGVQKVTVTFNKAVDAAATFNLKKGTTDILVAADKDQVKWSDDKLTATLTLKDGSKISAGDYSVTVGGLPTDSIDKATASFTAENEVLKKIDFANASDTIAQSTKARVKIIASNQYGEPASFPAGNYTANTSGFSSNLTKDDSGALILKIDTLNQGTSTTNPGITVVPVYIYDNDTRTTVQKTFKLGTKPFVTKVDLGEVKYASGKGSISATGDTATFQVNQYDQYGNPVAYDDTDAVASVSTFVSPFDESINREYGDFNNDNFGEVKVSLGKRIDKSGDYTVTVYAGGSSATATVAVKSARLATKLEFADSDVTLAERDVDQYIPVNAYDADGNKLSVDDLVDDQNIARIKITASGAQVDSNNASIGQLEKNGEHKGQIHIYKITSPVDTTVVLQAYIAEPGANSYVTHNYKINKVRVPETIKVDTDPASKIVANTDSEGIFKVYDNYGKVIDKIQPTTIGGTDSTVTENGATVTYRVYTSVTPIATSTATTPVGLTVVDNDGDGQVISAGNKAYDASANGTTNFKLFNKGFKFKSAGTIAGKIEYTAQVQKHLSTDAAGVWREVSTKVTKTIEAVNANTADVTYSVGEVGTVFAAIDSDLLTAGQNVPGDKPLSKEVAITATDASGNKIATPGLVSSVTSSNYSAVVAGLDSVKNKAWVIGNKAGTSKVTIQYKNLKGESKTATLDVTTKADSVDVATITSDSNYTDILAASSYAWKYMDLNVKDQYGDEFTENEIYDYDKVIGIRYALTDATTGVTIDSVTGQVSGAVVGSKFTIRAIAPNGKSTSTSVEITAS
jgi:hypothetical protein